MTLDKKQRENIRDLVIQTIQEAKHYKTISPQEAKAMEEYCISGEAAMSLLEKLKSGEITI